MMNFVFKMMHVALKGGWVRGSERERERERERHRDFVRVRVLLLSALYIHAGG